MFYDPFSGLMRPAVYVSYVDTLFFEKSCGSGSAALGVWLCRDQSNGSFRYLIEQPGGKIETEVEKKDGKIISITIGGEVKLGAPQVFRAQFPPVKNLH